MLMEELNLEVKNHMSTIEDEDAVLIKELLTVKAESDSTEKAESSKSIVDVYEDELAEQLNNVSKKKKKTRREEEEEALKVEAEKSLEDARVIEIGKSITVKELAEKLEKPTNDVIRTLIFSGVMAGVNQEVDFETAKK